jgi:hypothetical protein
MLHYWKEHAGQSRSHRVALVYSDVLAVKPVDYGTHAFLFDLAFGPTLYLDVIEWLADECIVTSNAARECSYLPNVLETLKAVEVARTRGVSFFTLSLNEPLAKTHPKCRSPTGWRHHLLAEHCRIVTNHFRLV